MKQIALMSVFLVLIMASASLAAMAPAEVPASSPPPPPGMDGQQEMRAMISECTQLMRQMMAGMRGGMMGAGGMMGVGMGPMYWWAGLQMFFFWLVLLGGLALLVVLLRRQGHGGSESVNILKVRYARGEITPEQYEEGRRLLGG